jgi:Mrp family chromosome partitioning ATPase
MANADGPDYFHALLRNLPWPSSDAARSVRTIGMTSCYSSEGVSTIAIQSAVAAAGSGKYSVLLVDANFADPNVHRVFDLPVAPGLAEALSSVGSRRPAMHRTRLNDLSILPAGKGDAVRLYEAVDDFAALVTELKKGFDLTIFDMPASGQASQASHLFRLFDGVVLVVEDERVRWEVAQSTTKRLRQAGANLLGVALNRRHEHIPDWLYRRM